MNKEDLLQKRALELGVQSLKLIETSLITVSEWVQWKYKYGCPLYNKDGLHPPFAPSAEETKKVLQEYNKALLLNGPDGPLLSRYALQLKHEAYTMGFYKAFALLALPFGAAPSWQTGQNVAQSESLLSQGKNNAVRPLMEACGIDVFKTAWDNGYQIDTRKETYGHWNFFALLLLE